MQNWILLLVAVAMGFFMPTQAAINNKLSTFTQNPVLTAIVSFGTGLLLLIAYALAARTPLSNLALARNAPPVAWLGGTMGAIYVVMVTSLVPKLGVALLFSLIVAGQMLITLLFDHYGILGVPVKEVNLPRVLGILLIIAGVILVRKF
jgi:bacterial/archaeal transporter family-2 protein